MKTCKICNQQKDLSLFSKHKQMKDGYRNECKECMLKRSKRYKLECDHCKKTFKTQHKHQKCCSRQCAFEYVEVNGLKAKEKHWNWNGGKIVVKCDYCGKEAKKKKGQSEKYKNLYCSRQCAGKHAEETGKFVGENSTSYNPDLTDEDREDRRKKPEHKKWVKEVMKKDNYRCVICGEKGKIQAHHLDGYNWCKEKRTDVNNGVTLCKKEHLEFHSIYGYGWNTKEQFEKFLIAKGVELS